MTDAYTIKPLEWSALTEDSISAECEARNSFGVFQVRRNHRGEWFCLPQLHGRWGKKLDCNSMDDAKAKCEAVYRSHILTALQPAVIRPDEEQGR